MLIGYHPHDRFIGSPGDKVITSRSIREKLNMAMISQIEPKSIDEVIIYESWVEATQEEISQFDNN